MIARGMFLVLLTFAVVVVVFTVSNLRLPDEDISWQHQVIDTSDCYWKEEFVPYLGNRDCYFEAKERAETRGEAVDATILEFKNRGLFGLHPLVFNPIVSKGQESELTGTLHGSGSVLGAQVSGSIHGESRVAINYVFCWLMPERDGREKTESLCVLPYDKVAVHSQEQGPPTVRFKYNIGMLTGLLSWEYEVPSGLVTKERVLYADISISPEQIAEGYIGLR